jgi:limonene-1,2-epoxide hydrolase
MATHTTDATRRRFLTLGAAGLAVSLGTTGAAAAAEPTAAEKANMKVVSDFCAAFAGDDVDTIMGFFADPCSYRVTEARDPIKGFAAVKAQIGGLVTNAEHFEVLDTFARGPMVFNERIDYFTPGGSIPLKSWHGVGVFLLKDGKIVEWQDYTISTERA